MEHSGFVYREIELNRLHDAMETASAAFVEWIRLHHHLMGTRLSDEDFAEFERLRVAAQDTTNAYGEQARKEFRGASPA